MLRASLSRRPTFLQNLNLPSTLSKVSYSSPSLFLSTSRPILILVRWWSVFWVLFQAKNCDYGTEDAMLYHKVRPIQFFRL
jgi:hypothetical protein